MTTCNFWTTCLQDGPGGRTPICAAHKSDINDCFKSLGNKRCLAYHRRCKEAEFYGYNLTFAHTGKCSGAELFTCLGALA